MSYTLLGSNLPARKSHYNFPSQPKYDLRYDNRVIDDYTKLTIKQGLDKFSSVVYKNVLMNLHYGFSACRSAFDESINMSRSFEKQLYILLEKVFEILEMQQLRVKVEAFDCFKYCMKIKRFSMPKQDLSYRIAIKNLAMTQKVKKFRKSLIQISKLTRLNYQALKMRFFMNVCQNFLTKNDKRKDMYLGFREWHLQTVIRNLSILNDDQTSLAYENRKFAIMNFHTVIMKHVQKVFFVLKNSSAHGILLQRYFFSRLRLQEFLEKVSRPFYQRALISFPRANISKRRLKENTIYGLSLGFSQLKRVLNQQKNEKVGKQKGIIHLVSVLSKRLFQKYSFAFLKLNELKPQIKEAEEFTESQNKATETIFTTLLQRVKKNYLAGFYKIACCPKKTDPIQFNRFLIRVGLNKLHLLSTKPRISTLLQSCFCKWKSETFKGPQETIFIHRKFKIIQLKDTIQALVLKNCRLSFNKIHSKALESIKESKKVVTYNEDEHIMLGTLMNQAVVNRQLELRHQKKHEKVNKTRQLQALLNILLKAHARRMHDRSNVSRFLRKWQENISFRNAKVKEYNKYLEVLENENDLLTRDILQLEQANMDTTEKNSFMRNQDQFDPDSPANVSSKRLDFGRQIRYLEFLEIQNSNLMEILKTNEPDFEDQQDDMEEIQEEIYRRISRSYSF